MSRRFDWVAVVTIVVAACGGPELIAPDNGDAREVELPGSWSLAAPMPEAVVAGAAAVLDGKIYVVGGSAEGESRASAKAFRFDPGTNSWERLADLPEGLWRPAAAALDASLLVLGGNLLSDALAPRSNVWRWNDDAGEWVHQGNLPLASVSPLAAGTSEGVLVAGLGGLQFVPGDSTAFLSTMSNEWRYSAPAPFPVTQLAPNGREVWALGLSGHAIYDAHSGSWGATQTLPTTGFTVGIWLASGRRHLITRNGNRVSHLVLEASSTTWATATPPVEASQRREALAVAIGDALYLISGTVAGEPTTRVDVFTGY